MDPHQRRLRCPLSRCIADWACFAVQRLDRHYILTRYPNGFDTGAPFNYYTHEEGSRLLWTPSVFTTFASSRFIDHEAVPASLRQCAQRLRATHPDVCAVYLFGSFATGRARRTAMPISSWKSPQATRSLTGITGQDGLYLAEFLLAKGDQLGEARNPRAFAMLTRFARERLDVRSGWMPPCSHPSERT